MTEIRYTKHGIANSYPKEDIIELNEHLDEPLYEQLKSKILRHEHEHISAKNKGFWEQRKIDGLTTITFFDLIPFLKKHPLEFFYQYLPITYDKEKKTIFFEFSLIFLYLIITGFIFLVYTIIKDFSTTPGMALRIIIYSVIGLVILLFLYQLGKRLQKSINDKAKEVTTTKK